MSEAIYTYLQSLYSLLAEFLLMDFLLLDLLDIEVEVCEEELQKVVVLDKADYLVFLVFGAMVGGV